MGCWQVRRGLVERAEAAEEKAVALEAERVLLQAQLSNLRKELATVHAVWRISPENIAS